MVTRQFVDKPIGSRSSCGLPDKNINFKTGCFSALT